VTIAHAVEVVDAMIMRMPHLLAKRWYLGTPKTVKLNL
jgi:hypothetical protein